MSESIPVHPQNTPSNWLLLLSGLMVGAGLVVIAAPHIDGVRIGLVVAWMLLFSSALHLAFARPFRTEGPVVWQLLMAVAYGAIGLYLLGLPAWSADSVRLPLAVYLLAEGLLECSLFSQTRNAGRTRLLLVDGVLTLVIGGMVWSAWPSSAGWAMAALIGINMIFGGITRFLVTIALRGERS